MKRNSKVQVWSRTEFENLLSNDEFLFEAKNSVRTFNKSGRTIGRYVNYPSPWERHEISETWYNEALERYNARREELIKEANESVGRLTMIGEGSMFTPVHECIINWRRLSTVFTNVNGLKYYVSAKPIYNEESIPKENIYQFEYSEISCVERDEIIHNAQIDYLKKKYGDKIPNSEYRNLTYPHNRSSCDEIHRPYEKRNLLRLINNLFHCDYKEMVIVPYWFLMYGDYVSHCR